MINFEDFVKIFDYIKDNTKNDGIPPEIQQAAKDSELKTEELFKRVFDQISFSSPDYNRTRDLLINWYSSLKTTQDIQRNTTDAFSVPSKILNTALNSFGFPYGDNLQGSQDKALFLYSLTELYKIKGTPQSIKTALEFFGLSGIELFEWWLYYDKNEEDIYLKSKYVDLGDTDPETISTQRIPIDSVKLDEHWWYEPEKIIEIQKTGIPIGLPSITPYFSVSAIANLSLLQKLYTIIARVVSDQWEEFENGNLDPYKNMFFDEYDDNISVVELIMSIAYIYNSWTGRTFTLNDTDNYQIYADIDPEDYDEVIVDEDNGITMKRMKYDEVLAKYNEVIERPVTRDEREAKLSEYHTRFTKMHGLNFVKEVVDPEDRLTQMNPELKTWIDDYYISKDLHEKLLLKMLRELDVFSYSAFKISSVSFANVILGLGSTGAEEVLNFFKPKRARLLDFNLRYEFDDTLMHSVILDDEKDFSINTTENFNETPEPSNYDRCYPYDAEPARVYDCLKVQDVIRLYDCVPRPGCRGSLGYDIGDPFAKFDCPSCSPWPCGTIHKNYDGNFIFDVHEPVSEKQYDTGVIYDEKQYDTGGQYEMSDGLWKTYDRNHQYDEAFKDWNMGYIPWWNREDFPEPVCMGDTFRDRPIEIIKDNLSIYDEFVDVANITLNFREVIGDLLPYDYGSFYDDLPDVVHDGIVIIASDSTSSWSPIYVYD